jgi:hypothetical protein
MTMPAPGPGGAPAAAPPPTITELQLGDDVKAAIGSALVDGNPMVVAYVDTDGQPSLSFRGSTHVYSPSQLAIWVRNADGGLLKSVAANNKVTLLYRNPTTRANLVFRGEAHIENSPDIRDKVYSGAPEREQQADPEKKGMPLIVNLTRVDGMMMPNRYAMKK